MPVANYDEVFQGYGQAPGILSGPAGVSAHTEVAIPGVSGSFGGQVVAPRVAGMLLFAGAVLAALKLSGIRFNVGM